jgi:hypothetical protein
MLQRWLLVAAFLQSVEGFAGEGFRVPSVNVLLPSRQGIVAVKPSAISVYMGEKVL